jgi:hypothetical protein
MDLADHLIKIAKDSGAKEQVINDLLNSGRNHGMFSNPSGRNHGMFSNPRNYRDILETRFDAFPP